MQPTSTPTDFDLAAFAEKAEQLYAERFKEEFEKIYHGKVVAIEPESGECFLGDSKMDAAISAKKRFPDGVFHFIRIGHQAMYKRR
ncbi:hypothetical protein HUU40_24450 [candidate division KSB1 bacterium]|nr:hypothetical protein [candidate division KSB1 bacterium]